MRAVIQRVSEASVKVNDIIKGSIGKGFLVLLGIENNDNQEDIEWLSGKIVRLRIFNDANQVMNLTLHDISGEILLISQFTLHASTKKGNRPSYIKALNPKSALLIYEDFIKQIGFDLGREIKTGVFGADMKVSLINDGPVTIIIDTKNKE